MPPATSSHHHEPGEIGFGRYFPQDALSEKRIEEFVVQIRTVNDLQFHQTIQRPFHRRGRRDAGFFEEFLGLRALAAYPRRGAEATDLIACARRTALRRGPSRRCREQPVMTKESADKIPPWALNPATV